MTRKVELDSSLVTTTAVFVRGKSLALIGHPGGARIVEAELPVQGHCGS